MADTMAYKDQDPNELYNTVPTWDELYKGYKSEGLTDAEIKNKLSNTRWNTPGSKYANWASGVVASDQAMQQDTHFDTPNEEAGNALADEYEREKLLRERGLLDIPDAEPGDLPEINNTPQEEVKKEEANKAAEKVNNIFEDSMLGKLPKEERKYLIFDAINTALSNAGNTLLNIAAAYTGGSANAPTNQKSTFQTMSEDYLKGKNEARTSAAQRQTEGSKQEAEKKQESANLVATNLNNEKVRMQLKPAEYYDKLANDDSMPSYLRNTAMLLSASAAGNEQGVEDYVAGAITGLNDEVKARMKAKDISQYEATQEIVAELSKTVGSAAAGALGGAIQGTADAVIEAGKDIVNNLKANSGVEARKKLNKKYPDLELLGGTGLNEIINAYMKNTGKKWKGGEQYLDEQIQELINSEMFKKFKDAREANANIAAGNHWW